MKIEEVFFEKNSLFSFTSIYPKNCIKPAKLEKVGKINGAYSKAPVLVAQEFMLPKIRLSPPKAIFIFFIGFTNVFWEFYKIYDIPKLLNFAIYTVVMLNSFQHLDEILTLRFGGQDDKIALLVIPNLVRNLEGDPETSSG